MKPPLDWENVINSYVAHLRRIRDPKMPVEDKALHLGWVFHQAQDVHQPLHAVARFSRALPEGDRGGNGVAFPSPGPGGRMSNLHAYWDGFFGNPEEPDAVDRLFLALPAEALISGKVWFRAC